jgi:hypothetical protein
MIRYALNCGNGHVFESWFQNSAAYDKQEKRSLVTCPICGSAKVEKAIMAPSLAQSPAPHPADNASQSPSPPPHPNSAPPPPLSPTLPSPASAGGIGTGLPPIPPKTPVAMMSPVERELRQKLKELRDHITKNANYVGTKFPEEARKIHYGETERRSIYGEASPDEAKELHEEGIEFHPIPILPDDQN